MIMKVSSGIEGQVTERLIMQAPWLLVYVASKQRELDVRMAAERQAQVVSARQARRERRRRGKH